MSNYYYDTEFLEGAQQRRFLGIPIGKTKLTIDLISIGIVAEDERECYAISKDFNLKEAWNRFQLEQQSGDMRNVFPEGKRVYWIRENVLFPIFKELSNKYYDQCDRLYSVITQPKTLYFNIKDLKFLLEKYGKTNKKISEDIKDFVGYVDGGQRITKKARDLDCVIMDGRSDPEYEFGERNPKVYNPKPTFYGYYSAYDHVVFCWLFGRMIDLPNGFPMYTRDLKQILDEKSVAWNIETHVIDGKLHGGYEPGMNWKDHPKYPKQENEHSAIDDARWNKKLHEFIQSI